MTDETKKLFCSPWNVEGMIIRNKEDNYVCSASPDNIDRISHLPELYDALMETVYYKCFECMGGLRHNIDLTREELVKNGCPKQNKSNVCIYLKHIELLRKVRDGE